MASLTVWTFNTATGAREASDDLAALQTEGAIDVIDGSLVVWPAGRKKPYVDHQGSSPESKALWGSFWGLLFGVIFFVPILGAAVGAAIGVLSHRFNEFGISDELVSQVRESVKEGTSALFLLVERADLDQVARVFADATLLRSDLSQEQLARLRDAFEADQS